MRWWLVVGVALATLAGCVELLPPGFPHRAHLGEGQCGGDGQLPCPTCATCHEEVRRDAEGTPGVGLCVTCHRDQAEAKWASVRKGSQKRTDILFSHEGHLGAFRGQCLECHSGVVDDGTRGEVFPPMQLCIDCHDDGLQADACSSCHRQRDLHRLVPETFLRHDGTFFRNHGLVASREAAACATCHAETDCVRCHEQGQPFGLKTIEPDAIDRTRIHRGDFVVRHAIEARSQSAQCVRCHTPSFCDACHLERGISGNSSDPLNPHPIGWIGPDTAGRNHHGRAARRDVVGCAGCHDAGPATNCIRCHAVGGPGGNPHPAGWRSMRSPDAPMCRYCHAP